jgi:predicted Fe-Mo cluster-binding NifX family protein
MLFIYMKVAVALFKNSIAPRADIADELVVYEIKRRSVVSRIRYKVFLDASFQFQSLMTNLQVNKIACGSYPSSILNMLKSNGIDAYMNIMGSPDVFIKKMLDGASFKCSL